MALNELLFLFSQVANGIFWTFSLRLALYNFLETTQNVDEMTFYTVAPDSLAEECC